MEYIDFRIYFNYAFRFFSFRINWITFILVFFYISFVSAYFLTIFIMDQPRIIPKRFRENFKLQISCYFFLSLVFH